MKLLNQLWEEVERASAEEIKKAINKRMEDLELEGVKVDSVSLEIDGETLVTFVDDDNNEMVVLFSYNDEGAEVIFLDADDADKEDAELEMIDLDGLEPKIFKINKDKSEIDLINNKWMTDGFFQALFDAGPVATSEQLINEITTFVVRGGKKVKVNLVRRKRKRRLTPAQKAGIKRGARKRKQNKNAISRKRKKSLKLRKRSKLKKNTNKRLKVQGT